MKKAEIVYKKKSEREIEIISIEKIKEHVYYKIINNEIVRKNNSYKMISQEKKDFDPVTVFGFVYDNFKALNLFEYDIENITKAEFIDQKIKELSIDKVIKENILYFYSFLIDFKVNTRKKYERMFNIFLEFLIVHYQDDYLDIKFSHLQYFVNYSIERKLPKKLILDVMTAVRSFLIYNTVFFSRMDFERLRDSVKSIDEEELYIEYKNLNSTVNRSINDLMNEEDLKKYIYAVNVERLERLGDRVKIRRRYMNTIILMLHVKYYLSVEDLFNLKKENIDVENNRIILDDKFLKIEKSDMDVIKLYLYIRETEDMNIYDEKIVRSVFLKRNILLADGQSVEYHEVISEKTKKYITYLNDLQNELDNFSSKFSRLDEFEKLEAKLKFAWLKFKSVILNDTKRNQIVKETYKEVDDFFISSQSKKMSMNNIRLILNKFVGSFFFNDPNEITEEEEEENIEDIEDKLTDAKPETAYRIEINNYDEFKHLHEDFQKVFFEDFELNRIFFFKYNDSNLSYMLFHQSILKHFIENEDRFLRTIVQLKERQLKPL